MYDDTIVTVDSIEIEHLNKEKNVFNFEVENAHTYYVTDKAILVHNDCVLDPSDIRYTQDSIKSTFKDGTSVDDMVDGLRKGNISKNDVKSIRVFQKDGKIYSLDNRRLYAFKKAGMKEINVKWINPTSNKYCLLIKRHFTTINDGVSILIR